MLKEAWYIDLLKLVEVSPPVNMESILLMIDSGKREGTGALNSAI
jgi:hypothetical protein